MCFHLDILKKHCQQLIKVNLPQPQWKVILVKLSASNGHSHISEEHFFKTINSYHCFVDSLISTLCNHTRMSILKSWFYIQGSLMGLLIKMCLFLWGCLNVEYGRYMLPWTPVIWNVRVSRRISDRWARFLQAYLLFLFIKSHSHWFEWCLLESLWVHGICITKFWRMFDLCVGQQPTFCEKPASSTDTALFIFIFFHYYYIESVRLLKYGCPCFKIFHIFRFLLISLQIHIWILFCRNPPT